MRSQGFAVRPDRVTRVSGRALHVNQKARHENNASHYHRRPRLHFSFLGAKSIACDFRQYFRRRGGRRQSNSPVPLQRFERGARGYAQTHRGNPVARQRDGHGWIARRAVGADAETREILGNGLRLPQFITTIDGVDVHFIHVRSKEKNALPLIITHGWPGSIIEQMKIIGPLTDPTAYGGKAEDAFDVVIPSLPGHGFSGKPATTGWG